MDKINKQKLGTFMAVALFLLGGIAGAGAVSGDPWGQGAAVALLAVDVGVGLLMWPWGE